jgi:hypothetical protein
MGTLCNKNIKEKEIVFSTKAILQPANFEKMSFYFSTENLLRIDADCLVLFCDEKINLSKNIHLSQVGKDETRKIAEYADSYLNNPKSKMIPGQVIIFPISIPTLRFKNVCLICLKIWDGHEKVKMNMENIVEAMFKEIQQKGTQSIALTEFNEEFGIPTQLGCKVIIEALEKCKEWLKVTTFICNDINTQTYYM